MLDRLRAHAPRLVVTERRRALRPDFLMTARLDVPAAAPSGLRARRARRLGDAAAGAGLSEAFVFFKHEDAGAGPRLAAEFLELAERVANRRGPRSVAAPAAGRGTPEREVG